MNMTAHSGRGIWMRVIALIAIVHVFVSHSGARFTLRQIAAHGEIGGR